jgi:hypothetical protein
MIQQVLAMSGKFENTVNLNIDANGRARPGVDSRLLDYFPAQEGGWYNRTWSDQDCKRLSELAATSDRCWIIGTHRREQLNRIKQRVSVNTLGITYAQSLYPAVIKNWCKKSAYNSQENEQIYSVLHPVTMRKFKQKGLYAEFILTEILNHVNTIPREQTSDFEINIALEQLYNHDLTSVSKFVSVEGQKIFDLWWSLQDPLYKFCFEHNDAYVDILGYNTQSTRIAQEPIQLSSLDNILISWYCKQHGIGKPANCNTQIDLVNFLIGQQR